MNNIEGIGYTQRNNNLEEKYKIVWNGAHMSRREPGFGGLEKVRTFFVFTNGLILNRDNEIKLRI